MTSLKSKDGTTIAFDKRGNGPALIFVDGAMSTRSSSSKSSRLRPFQFRHGKVVRKDSYWKIVE